MTGRRFPGRLATPWRRYPSAAELEARTPPDRDRVVDLVRGGSLLVVVFGHSFMALVVFTGTVVTLSNTLEQTPFLQPVTWVLQIMPLFFAAGAWANALSYRHATSYPVWLSARVRRLLRPVILYVGFWILASPLLLAWNHDITLPLLRISTQLLWFLGAYLLVTALTPLLVRFSAHPALASLGWLAAATAVDVSNLLGAPPALRLLNFVLVWALAGQTGLWVFSPNRRPPRRIAVLVALAGLTANALLVRFGPWPVSLVGLPGERISNMAPPSTVMALHAVTLAALVVLAYRAAGAAGRPGPRLAGDRRGQRRGDEHLSVAPGGADPRAAHAARLLPGPGRLLDGGLGGAAAALLGDLLHLHLRPRLAGTSVRAPVLPWWDDTPLHSPTSWLPYRARATVSVIGAITVAVALLALSVTGLIGFPFNSSTSYAGFSFTPGLAIAVALLGMVLVRVAAVGDIRPGPSISARGAERAPTG